MTSAKITDTLVFALQALLVGCVVVMSVMTEMPWPAIAGLGALGVSLVVPEVMSGRQQERVWRQGAIAAGGGTLLALAGLLFPSSQILMLDGYYSLLAALMAVAVGLASRHVTGTMSQQQWRGLALTSALCGSVGWVVIAYVHNLSNAFYTGLLFSLALLVASKFWMQMRTVGVLTVNTLILAIILLPLVDFASRPREARGEDDGVARRDYSYEAGREDFHAFARWWDQYAKQADQMVKALYDPDLEGGLPLRLHPNGQTMFFQSRIRINSLGFRGREFSVEKGGAYRIVALGESTTFGLTVTPEHRPWSEWLEQMIRERLKLSRPVEVVNAGVPTFSLVNNLQRLSADILPLKPDMLISYHGWNGFQMLNEALPPILVKHPPAYKRRPLRLLADCEYRLKLIRFKRSQTEKLMKPPPSIPKPMETAYAAAYEQLAQIARTNGIRLVLANYAMAVNSDSDEDVIEFYREVFPAVDEYIKANQMHSGIVQAIAQQHPEVCFVDARPHLDGEHAKFIDLMHFTPEGDQQLAETFFAGIRKILDEDLSGAPD